MSTTLPIGAGAILVGDARARLRDVPEASCRACITSPPYWGLRRYGYDPDELGRESHVDLYVAALLDVMREVRRCLTPDGTLWLNLGDCYARAGGAGGGYGSASQAHPQNRMNNERRRRYPDRAAWGGTPDKGLIGLPWRVALALQQDGWVWRTTVPWIRRNPMPESVRDRPVAGCEYVLMLARSGETYYDVDAVRRPRRDDRPRRLSGQRRARTAGLDITKTRTIEISPHEGGRLWRASDSFFDSLSWALDLDYEGLVLGEDGEPLALITAIHPSDTGHAAPYPAELVEPLVRVSSAAGDAVLDPFLGSGTTAMVAQRLGRRWWGCEIYACDAERAAARIRAKASQLVIGGAA